MSFIPCILNSQPGSGVAGDLFRTRNITFKNHEILATSIELNVTFYKKYDGKISQIKASKCKMNPNFL